MKQKILLAIVLIMIVGALVYLSVPNNTLPVVEDIQGSNTDGESGAAMTDTQGEIIHSNEVMMGEVPQGYVGEVLAGDASPYLAFTKRDYDKAQGEGKIVLLYFYANWCPICIDEEKHVYEAFNALTRDDIVGFRVNYRDSEADSFEEQLAKDFGVTYQHTKVILKDGEQVTKAPNSWDTDDYTEAFAEL